MHASLIIDGKAVEAVSGERFESLDPANGQAIATVSRGGPPDIDRAVAAARRAYEQAWRPMPTAERGQILRRIAELIREYAEELSELESRDTGKPLSQARTDVGVASRYFDFYAGVADKLFGETIPIAPESFAYTVREPYGVTGHIVPWNYPIQIGSRTVAPALAAGNCCVLKPAEEAPLTGVRLGELGLEAGLPPGVLNVVPGFGEEAGRPLASHPGVDHVSFTGSVEVGREVMRNAAANITPVTLELGGKSPHIVLADADLAAAVPVILKAIIQNAGQTCSAGTRVVVDRRVEAELLDALAQGMASVRMGPGVEDPDMGPLISEAQLRRVAGYVDRGRREGARLVTGGERPDDAALARGFFFEPTLFADVKPDAAIAREEIFGPVLAALSFDGIDEAVRIANDTPYGLVTAIWTRDIDRALWTAGRIDSGQIFINTYGAGGGVELPFGGFKQSGFGREKGMEAVLGYTQTKTVAVHIRKPT
jgi:aldehyde dehydrogenase (NAD+)/betaine-aldehyde dehydrogenase